MISVIIPARNAEHTLPATLSALVPAAVDGLVKQVIVVDGGSTDQTAEVADQAGADIVKSAPGRGGQLAQGAEMARFPWLLFLNADTVLEDGWERSAMSFMRRVEFDDRSMAAGAFTFRLDDQGLAPRLLELVVRLRCKFLGVPFGDQGLLIPRRLFDDVGGYRNLPIMEDLDLARRIGRRRIAMLDANAVTSAERYRRDGYLSRSFRNQICHLLYGAGIPVSMIARLRGKLETGA
ncbi:MAG: TIGR04283 family arsenosugar biosynthesis glycosyltransferase [Proteobacteria bacterium]|nr:TIGR04283 family arsenosugar biosynthesis glycosyltransferase [Pseudomonadota bacterium]